MGATAAATNNKEAFSTSELDEWAALGPLLQEESTLIDQYLNPTLSSVEGGTGGGRIIFQLLHRGFIRLAGYDYVPEHIKAARERDTAEIINFSVQDASHLNYHNQSFDQLIYFQQLLSFLEGEESRKQAISEAYRILKPGGVGLFSFLSFDARQRSLIWRGFFAYLRALRALGLSRRRPIQELPWLKLAGRYNWGALFDHGPFAHWFQGEKVLQLFRDAGFEVINLGYPGTIARGEVYQTFQDIPQPNRRGMLYLVAKRRG